MVELTEFFPRLLPYVQGCPDSLAKQALLDSAIGFCKASACVSVELDPVTVLANIDTYELDVPDQTTVATVQKVWYDGTLITPMPYDMATGQYSIPAGTPRYYFGSYIDEVYSLTLVPTPDTTLSNALRVRVALTPTRSATKVHDILYERYIEGVINGAIAIIANVPDESYTDFGKASAAGVAARINSNLARQEIMHGNVTSSLSVKMRGF